MNILYNPEKLISMRQLITKNHGMCYDTDLKTLLKIVSNSELRWIYLKIYKSWQNNYDDIAMNQIIAEEIIEKQCFIDTLKSYNIKERTFVKWLQSKNIIKDIIEESCINGKLCNDDIGTYFSHLGIERDSSLCKSCCEKFLLYCNFNAYEQLGEDYLIRELNQMGLNNQKLFISNYIHQSIRKSNYEFQELALIIECIVLGEQRKEPENYLLKSLLSKKSFRYWNRQIKQLSGVAEYIE